MHHPVDLVVAGVAGVEASSASGVCKNISDNGGSGPELDAALQGETKNFSGALDDSTTCRPCNYRGL